MANLVTIAVAFFDGSLLLLLWPYWLQSLIIGYYAQRRIRLLQRFSTTGLKINDQSVDPTPATRRRTANFFVLHYGLFHLVYFFFLWTFTSTADSGGMISVLMRNTGRVNQVAVGRVGGIDLLIIVALALGFLWTHRASFREHVAADLEGTPNLGTLMFMPYVRIIPMHLTIILGVIIGARGGIIIFGALKTVADVLMHKIEHKLLQQMSGAAPVTPPT